MAGQRDADAGGSVVSDRLRTLVDFAAVHGRALLVDRLDRIERDIAERRPELPGMTDQLRSRVEAARLALGESNGFAVAWVIEQAEQIVTAINAELAAPMVKAAAGSALGRDRTRPGIKFAQVERISAKDKELHRLLEEDRRGIGHSKQRSSSAVAARLAPLFNAWAEKVGERPLKSRTIRKWLADQK